MDFEFDQQKSDSNKYKNGIDFEEARALRNDYDYAEINLKSDDEQRFMVVAAIGEKFRSAICTVRNNRIRIISVRRSRRSEVEIYYKGK